MGANISGCVESGPAFALHEAVRSTDLGAIQLRLQRDPTLLKHHQLVSKDTVWHIAANNTDALEALLAVARRTCDDAEIVALINSKNDKGQAPIMFAASCGNAASVKWFISQGADPWARDQCGNRTALHYGALKGSGDVINALLDSLPPSEALRYVDVPSIGGFTPLHYAAAVNKPAAARVLLQRGANILSGNPNVSTFDLIECPRRTTPLHVAAMQINSADLVHDPRRRPDSTGRLPYQVALDRGNIMTAEVVHPHVNLERMFGAVDPSVKIGVPRLAQLAGRSVKQHLLDSITKAEADIADYRKRHPEDGSPTFMMLNQAPVIKEPISPPKFLPYKRLGFVDSDFSHRPILPVEQCLVCLDDTYCLLAEACHHRLCAGCARDITKKQAVMPLPCPMCRCSVMQFSSPV